MSICSSLSSSYGFHPKLLVNLTVPSLKDGACDTYLFFELPPLVFIDKFEFPFQHRLWGSPDLELPVHALESQNSTFVTIDLERPAAQGDLHLEIPLHLRYGQPRSGGGYETIKLDRPKFFAACPGDGKGSPLHTYFDGLSDPFRNPFNQEDQSLIYISGCSSGLEDEQLTLFVPVGNLDHLPMVQYATAFLVLVSSIWVARAIFISSKSSVRAPTSGGIKKEKSGL